MSAGAVDAPSSITTATDTWTCSYRNYVDFDLATAAEPGTNARCQFRGLAVNCGPRGLKGESNLLFHNNGDGTFTDVSEKSGIAEIRGNYGLGVLTGDFDNDGWPDIYVANDTNASLLVS